MDFNMPLVKKLGTLPQRASFSRPNFARHRLSSLPHSRRVSRSHKQRAGAADVVQDLQESRSYSNTDSSRTDTSEGSHQASFFEGLCGEHSLKGEQFDVFEEFSRSMRQCALAFACVSASSIILTFSQARQQVLHEPVVLLAGITVGNFAFWADSLVVAVLLHYGASSFQRVTEIKCKNQLPFIFQGISRLSLIFQQFAVAALAVAVVHTLEAAARYPPITKVAAAFFLLIAGQRSAALWWLMSKHSSLEGGGVPEMLARLKDGDKSGSPRWERFAMRLLVGHLLAYNIPGMEKQRDGTHSSSNTQNRDQTEAQFSQHEQLNGTPGSSQGAAMSRNGTSLSINQAGSAGALLASSSGRASSVGNSAGRGSAETSPGSQDESPQAKSKQGEDEYEFTGGEAQLMRICMDAMHTAGLALIVQGISTGLLGLANYLSGNAAGAASMCYNGVSKAVTAGLIFVASSAFDSAVSGPDGNVTSLLSAIGDKGLTKLFHQLTVFAWTVAFSQVLQLFLPIISKSPVANVLVSKFGSIFGQGLVSIQNLVAGLA